MVITQKITSLAFEIHDGKTSVPKKKKKKSCPLKKKKTDDRTGNVSLTLLGVIKKDHMATFPKQ